MNHQRHDGEDARRRILEAIDTLTAQYGIPPTVREVMEAAGLTSTGHVSFHVDQLRRDGWIDRRFAGCARGLVHTGAGVRDERRAGIDECIRAIGELYSERRDEFKEMNAKEALDLAQQRLMSLKRPLL